MATQSFVARRLGVILGAFALTITTACGGQSADTGNKESLTKIKFGSSTTAPGVENAEWISVPLKMGFWKEEHLDVQWLGFAGGAAVVQALDAGQIDVANANGLVYAQAAVRNVKSKVFYNYMTRDFTQPFYAVAGKGVESPKDLAGKTIGVSSLESGAVPIFQAMAARAGIRKGDYKLVPIGTGAESIEIVRRGGVDVVAMWDVHYKAMKSRGIDLKPIRDDFFDGLGFSLVNGALADFIKAHPKEIGAFGRGIAKGEVFTRENPEAAVRIHWKMFPDSRPTGVPEEKALADAVALIKLRHLSTDTVKGRWGYATPEQVKDAIEVVRLSGAANGPDIPVEKLWTDEFVNAFNDFDPEKVKAIARSYQQ